MVVKTQRYLGENFVTFSIGSGRRKQHQQQQEKEWRVLLANLGICQHCALCSDRVAKRGCVVVAW